jgi:hypothetical protein
MDPVSLTLSVIPLLISTAEHYKTTYDAFHRLRKASREAEMLRVDVLVQRTLFDDNCRDLLVKCDIDGSVIDAMLRNSRHNAWTGTELQAKINEILGFFSEAFVGLLQRIEAELSTIEDKVRSYLSIDRGIGWRVHLAATKPDLDKAIERVNRLNINLNDIRKRVDDATRRRKGTNPRVKPGPQHGRESRRPVEDFAIVRQVSQNLYLALARACNDHDRHDMLISLVPKVKKSSRCVQLELALRNPLQHSWIAVREHAIWVCVESLNVVNIAQSAASQTKLDFVSAIPGTSLSRASGATGRAPLSAQVLHSSASQSRGENFCRKVHGGPKDCPTRSCIGFFQHNRGAELEVFVIPKLQTRLPCPDVSTLADIFSQNPSSKQRALDPLSCVRLGSKLASAMLSFHSTSWLSPRWSSHQIRLLHSKSAANNNSPEEQEPYLDVTVGASGVAIDSVAPAFNDARVVDNSFLFRLGVILLELAFEQPLHHMRIDADTEDGLHLADFYTATRARHSVAGVLGQSYARIVDQCLKCNFRSGMSDLRESKLQQDVYEDIVCKLDSLEQKLQPAYA